ncbi:MAG: response regulator [Planctomycetota bacterium]
MAAGRILIVDDDEDIRANFSDILCELGYETSLAGDGESALQLVREKEYDVVLLDYQMPGMDGATLYDAIKKVRPSIAGIMVTAWAGSDGAQRARDAGTWEVLRKPVDIAELLGKIQLATAAPLVLVVDDDHAFCQMLWRLLNERRFRVAIAHTEEDGIRQVSNSEYQVAIVDLKLGQGDGVNVIRRIQQAVPSTKTFLVSGNLRNAISASQEFEEAVIEAVLEKPLKLESINRMLG